MSPAPFLGLRPCPFCGGEACIALGKDGAGEKEWFAFCPRCRTHGPSWSNPEEATARWNMRVRLDPERERIISDFKDVLDRAEWKDGDLAEMRLTFGDTVLAYAIDRNHAGIEDLERSIADFNAALGPDFDENAWYDAVSSMTLELLNAIRRDCENAPSVPFRRKKSKKGRKIEVYS